jgi:hypothetical protein
MRACKRGYALNCNESQLQRPPRIEEAHQDFSIGTLLQTADVQHERCHIAIIARRHDGTILQRHIHLQPL